MKKEYIREKLSDFAYFIKVRINAALGSSADCIMAADCYRLGSGVRQNYRKALKLYKKAEKLGEPFGSECIGEMYYFGEGVIKNEITACLSFWENEGTPSSMARFCLGEIQWHVGDVSSAQSYYEAIVDEQLEHPDWPMDAYFPMACFRLAEMNFEYEWYEKARAYAKLALKYLHADNLVAEKHGITPEKAAKLWDKINQSPAGRPDLEE